MSVTGLRSGSRRLRTVTGRALSREPDRCKVAGMTVSPPLRMVPPLPSGVVSADGLPSVQEFGELVAAHADTGRTDWSPPSTMVAEWTARRLVEARAFIAEKAEERAAWVAQIDEWYSSVTGEFQSIVAFAEAALKAYALRHRAETKKATLKLPSLAVRTRSTPGATVVVDDEAFVKWAIENAPTALRINVEPIADEVAKYHIVTVTDDDGNESKVAVDAEGEIVPGVGWRDEKITATVP